MKWNKTVAYYLVTGAQHMARLPLLFRVHHK